MKKSNKSNKTQETEQPTSFW